MLVLDNQGSDRTGGANSRTDVLMWDSSLNKPEPVFPESIEGEVVNAHMLKNMVILVMRDRIIGYQISKNYESYLIDKDKSVAMSEMSRFGGTQENYGVLVVNNKQSGKCGKIDLHNFAEGNQVIHTKYDLETPPVGQITAVFFSQNIQLAFLFQENEKLISVYKWEGNKRLPLIRTVSLFTGNYFDRLKFPLIHHVYSLFGDVYLLYFRNEGFRLIDCEVEKKGILFKSHFYYDFGKHGETDLKRDLCGYPLVFVDFVKSAFEKPVSINVVG